MAVNKRLLQGAAAAPGGITPSEHFGVVLYEGDGSTSHSINGGKFGAGGYFNGSNGYISFNTKGINSTNVSVSAWIKPGTLVGSLGGVVSWGENTTGKRRSLVYTSGGTIGFSGYGGAANLFGTTTLSTSNWSHVVFTLSGSSCKLYLNGSLEASGTVTLASYSSTAGYIGQTASVNEYFDGKIDQVRIFNKELSSSEVSTLYAETASTVESLDPLSEDTTDTLQVLGDSSCVATYRFENNEDDLSGNYNGTGTAIQYAAGRYGQAASFNGSSSGMDVAQGALPSGGNARSVSMWIKTTTSTYSSLVRYGAASTNNYFLISLYADATTNVGVHFWSNDVTVNVGSALFDGNWHQLAMTYDGTNVKIYVDGVQKGSTANLGTTNTTASTIRIGYQANPDGSGAGSYFDGEMDQLRFFNKALSASEVTTLYNENSLVASYRFEGNAEDDTRNYNGTASNVTYEYGLNFTPDFVWIKDRSTTKDHQIMDSTRGGDKVLKSNLTDAEVAITEKIKSFDIGGFTVGNNGGVNLDGDDYVAWCLKANGGTTTSGSGTRISNVVNQVNSAAGFSITTFTGANTTATDDGNFTHGLGDAPDMFIVKTTSNSDSWFIYHKDLNGGVAPQDYAIRFTNAAEQDNVGFWNDTAPSNTHINVGSGILVNNWTYVCYAFKGIDGFSKFGSYTGNGSATGPIVETGFEPAFLMVKRTDAGSSNWFIYDNKRDTVNPNGNYLIANENYAENNLDSYSFYFLSNGFQVNSTDVQLNASGGTYIYMAFAADPDTEAPTVAKSFSTVTYAGNSGTQSIEGLGFGPGLTWIKARNFNTAGEIHDIVRGEPSRLWANENFAASTAYNGFVKLTSDGFDLDNVGAGGNVNRSYNYVAWNWKANDNEPTILPNTELSSLISKYKFEDNVNDSYGDNNGTASNLSYLSGRFGKAADFNGTSSKILYPQAAPFNDSNTILAISAWVKLDAASNEFVIMSASSTSDQADYMMLVAGGNRPGRVFMTDAPINANEYQANFGSGNDTNWNHYVWQLSASGGIELWYNGTKQTRTQTYQAGSLGSTSWFGDLTYASSVQYATGINRVVTTGYSNGSIDQMRLFNTELTSSEISSLYNEGLEALVSANANAGFSIVKWTGTGAINKVPHGLSSAPEMILIKDLDSASDWQVYHTSIGNGNKLVLNSTAAASSTTRWDSTSPTATVFTLRDIGLEGGLIAYCWHSVAGYSKFGSYSGTGTTNSITGLGFQPDWILAKRTDTTDNWAIIDSVREAYLLANLSDAEATYNWFEFTSDGFTLSTSTLNASGGTYIYAAFKIN